MLQNLLDFVKHVDVQQLWLLSLAVIVSVNALLAFIAPLTPWTWDDRIEAIIGKWIAKLAGKK